MTGLKRAFRTLAATPFLTAVAVLSLALGIGANAAIFSLFDQMLLRPLPVQEPDRLVNLSAPGPKFGSTSCNQAGDCDHVFSYPMYRDLERAETGFSGLAAHRAFSVNLALEGQTVNGEGMLVSGSYFPVLGLQPALGRLLGPADDAAIGEHYVAVLAWDYWDTQLGRDPSVLNRTLVVNGEPMTVVGVAPRGFRGTTLGSKPDVFVPLSMRAVMEPFFEDFENRRSYWAYVFGRLAPGVALEQARTQTNALYRGIVNDVEAPLQDGMSATTMERFRTKELVMEPGFRGQSSMHGEVRTPLVLLISITGLVLLIACANVANLLLARGVQRAPEMAVRGSLGANRRQLLGQLLGESLLLAALGGAASVLVASWTLAAVGSILPTEVGQILSLELRGSVFLFTAAVALGTGVLFGLYPALHATRRDPVTVIRGHTGQAAGSRAAARFRSGLVMAQIALSMTLLVVAGLFIRSLSNVSRVDLGLSTDNVVTFGVSPVLNGYEPDESAALFLRMEEELRALPGVMEVSSALVPVLTGSSWGSSVNVEGFESGPDVDNNSRFNRVGPGYLATLGMPLVAGREFEPGDDESAVPVAVVNEAFTEKFGLNGREAVGKYMGVGGDDELGIQIVGVVQDARYNEVKAEVPPLFLRPLSQEESLGWVTFYVRTATEPSEVTRAIPGVVKALDPNLPVERLMLMEDQVRENVFMDRMISTLSVGFAVLATVLAAVGLYGVLAYTVTLRTREIGLRMALGAAGGRVQGMVIGQVARMAVVGGIVGLGVALLLGRTASSLLFGLSGTDPLVMAAAAAVLAVVAMGAGYLPARRASSVDPMHALRYD